MKNKTYKRLNSVYGSRCTVYYGDRTNYFGIKICVFTKSIFILLCLLTMVNSAFAKFNFEKTKNITEEVSVNVESELSVLHDRGLLEVVYYDGEKAKLEANLLVKGDDEEDLETLLSQYKIDVERRGDDVVINSGFNISSWGETNVFFYKKYRIVFDDGTKINSKVKIVESKLKLWIPNVKKLKVKNSYNNIITSDLPFGLEATVFSGDIWTGSIDGDLSLNIKYGNAKLGDIKNAEIELFTAKMKVKNGGKITLHSKYSEVEMLNLEALNLNIFEGNIDMKNVAEKLDIKGRYADISIATIQQGEWDLFECDVVLEEAEKIEWTDRYGDHKITKIGNLEIDCFETDFDIKEVDKIVSKESRYCKFDIDQLNVSFKSKAAFEEKWNIQKLGDSFSGIDFKGRYGKLRLHTPKEYKLDLEVKYGKIDYDESKMEVLKHIEKSEKLTLTAKSKGSGDAAPMIKVSGFEVDVTLEE